MLNGQVSKKKLASFFRKHLRPTLRPNDEITVPLLYTYNLIELHKLKHLHNQHRRNFADRIVGIIAVGNSKTISEVITKAIQKEILKNWPKLKVKGIYDIRSLRSW